MSTKWQTPRALYEAMDRAVGGFAVDAAADEDNHLHINYYGPGSKLGIHPPLAPDALAVPKWLSPAWCNPPYLDGKAWEQWLDKFEEQAKLGVTIMALLPAKVGTQWWYHHVVQPRCDVFFLVGRVPFELPGRQKPTQPNHDSALVIYGPQTTGTITWIDWRTKVLPVDNPSEVLGDAHAPTSPGVLLLPAESHLQRVHDPKSGRSARLLRSRADRGSAGRGGSGTGEPVQGARGVQANEAPSVGGAGPSEV